MVKQKLDGMMIVAGASFTPSHPVPLSASIRARCFARLLPAANGNRSSSYR